MGNQTIEGLIEWRNAQGTHGATHLQHAGAQRQTSYTISKPTGISLPAIVLTLHTDISCSLIAIPL